ncbi:hypothetical protein [Krasilnikovia sp. M28-CT-15]|uniref:hypothetical protein n=1 Tax=Krasilnikovia sp. M28-CT-15 TaxID=3373540 RepID=UPI003876A747
MRSTKRIATAIVGSAASAALLLGTTATAAQAATYQGCPDGYVCLYPENAGWNGGHPSYKWYYYGSYNLSNQYGIHRIYNNQTGGAKAWLCNGWNGTNCPVYQPAGSYSDTNFTPINSVKLTAN